MLRKQRDPLGTPVAAGGGDCAAQAVGSSIVQEGKVSVTLGTNGVVFAQSDQYRVEQEGKLHAFVTQYQEMAFDGGDAFCGFFQWYKNNLEDLESKLEEEGRGCI